MSRPAGIDVIAALLADHAPLLQLVPIERIKMGRLPEGSEFPAIVLDTVSTIDQREMALGSKERLVERIAAKVRAQSHRQRRDIVDMVRQACIRDYIASIAGAEKVSVQANGAGPDLNGPSSSFDRTQDFRVSLQRDA